MAQQQPTTAGEELTFAKQLSQASTTEDIISLAESVGIDVTVGMLKKLILQEKLGPDCSKVSS